MALQGSVNWWLGGGLTWVFNRRSTMDQKAQWKEFHIYQGVQSAIFFARTHGPMISGCNADGIALQFHAKKDPETGEISVVVKEMLHDGKLVKLGDGLRMRDEILSKHGGLPGIDKIRMDRLYSIWGGKERYESMFGVMKGYEANYDDQCQMCGQKLMQKSQTVCRMCKNGE
jgi:hypothetical protein